MTTVLVPRLVATVVLSATLSLFSIVSVMTVASAGKLKWDGSFCAQATCAPTAYAQARSTPRT